MKIRINEIGQERNKVVVIDDLFPQIDELVTIAAQRPFRRVTDNSYPGLRFLLTADTQPEWQYIAGIIRAVGPTINEIFGVQKMRIAHASFSLMTLRPADAHPMTRLPHYDEVSGTQYALLHFLTPHAQGGTAFFRHRRTGFESISADRKALFHEGIRQDYTAFGEPPVGYMRGTNDAYEQTAYYEGRYNRMLIYSGALLHSAQVPDHFAYNDDPLKGRLTTNLFLSSV